MNHITPIETKRDVYEALRDTAMLADVAISAWSGMRTDKSIMDRAKAEAGATGNVGRAVKNMLAGADGLLSDARSAFSAIRMKHYALTLPWITDPHAERQRGARLLVNELFERYMEELGTQRRRAYQALDKFLDDYPDAIERARANLGTLADATYPTADEVRGLFSVALDIEPLPSGADFKSLPDQTLRKLSAGLARRQAARIESAQAAVFEEVRTRVRTLAERMGDPEARFRASTVEHVRDLGSVLGAWNITDDPRIAELENDIKRMISGVDAEKLREHADVRADVAEQASAVVDKLSGWGL